METFSKTPRSSKKDAVRHLSPMAKGAYILFSAMLSALIALISLLFILAIISLLVNQTLPGIPLPEKIPTWTIMTALFILYLLIAMPLKTLRTKLSPHKPYALYSSRTEPKYGDATLWFAFSLLFFWYASEHREELAAYLGQFPEWWRSFVDTIGPWFYQ